jgi:hypothetical protein
MPKIKKSMRGPNQKSKVEKSKVETKFFCFHQNNSGGSWKKGMPMYLIVEAVDAEDANRRAENAGAYFNGCDDGRDCSCCGDRWYAKWRDDEGTDEPCVYDKPFREYAASSDAKTWQHLATRVVYMDGRVEEA